VNQQAMEEAQEEVWLGRVPVCLEVGAQERFYALVPRVSYLWSSLPSALCDGLAPDSSEFSEAQWKSWPVGVLFDVANAKGTLPWRVKVKRGSTSSRSAYFHSLKQAVHLERGTARVALLAPKVDQDRNWRAIQCGDQQLFQDLEAPPTLRHVPVRLIFEAKSYQFPHLAHDEEGSKKVIKDAVFSSKIKHFIPPAVTVIAHGIPLDLDLPLLDAWKALRHPDHFLYLVIRPS